jgi:hypothetical protein
MKIIKKSMMAIIEMVIIVMMIITIRIKTSYGDNVYTNEIKSVRDRELYIW